MKIISTQSTQRAMTKIEMLIVVAVIALLTAILLAALAPAKARSSRIGCVSKLKQIGLGFLMWSNDHADKFPWAVPAVLDGTLELATTAQVFSHFQVVSNEMSSPKILTCPNDPASTRTSDWNQLNNSNLSYFAGLDGDEGRPDTILSGDRTISTNGNLMSGYLEVLTTGPVMWAKGIHPGAGNISLSDGSAQQSTSSSLQLQLQRPGLVVARFAVP